MQIMMLLLTSMCAHTLPSLKANLSCTVTLQLILRWILLESAMFGLQVVPGDGHVGRL